MSVRYDAGAGSFPMHATTSECRAGTCPICGIPHRDRRKPPLYNIRKLVFSERRWNRYIVRLATRQRITKTKEVRAGTDDTGPRPVRPNPSRSTVR